MDEKIRNGQPPEEPKRPLEHTRKLPEQKKPAAAPAKSVRSPEKTAKRREKPAGKSAETKKEGPRSANPAGEPTRVLPAAHPAPKTEEEADEKTVVLPTGHPAPKPDAEAGETRVLPKAEHPVHREPAKHIAAPAEHPKHPAAPAEPVNHSGASSAPEKHTDAPVQPPKQPEPFHDEEYRETFGEGEELERVFSDEPFPPVRDAEAPEQPESPEPPVRRRRPAPEQMPVHKGRPKRKKGYGLLGIPHILATLVWLVLIVSIGVSLGRVIWVCVADVLAFGREEQEVMLTIDDSDTLDDIANKLKDAGLIDYPDLFKVYGIFSDAREDISSGTFKLNTIYDYHALVGQMNYYASNREIVSVTIPEGYNSAQIFSLLEEKGVCTVEKLENYAATGDLDEYWFLEDVKRGDKYCLEGFLFPDTYDFYLHDDAEHVLEKLLDNFDTRFNEDMIAGIDTLNAKLSDMFRANGYDDAYIADHQMSVREIVTVASLIEKETAGLDESFTISSVIYNRLTNPGEYPYLNIDAALLYALGHKEALTAEDLQTDTPYNTYLYAGLVPGPITNPGLNSINAALMPSDTNYHFYVLDTNSEEREHHFSETLAEHEAFIESLGG